MITMADSKFRNILVFGGSSYVGQRLLNVADHQSVIATYNSNPFPSGISYSPKSASLSDIVDEPDFFSHAILLLGDTQPDSCIADPDKSHETNVEGLIKLIGELNEANIKPIFTSTEFVFDGEKGNYSETDEARPILLYGQQKLEIESYLKEHCEDYLIFRLAKVFGDEINDGTLFSGWARALKTGDREFLCAADQAFSPVYVNDVIQALALAVTENLSGLYHLSGGTRLSRMESLDLFLSEVGRQKGWSVDVRTCSIHDFDLPEKRPLDVSMRIDKLIADTPFTTSPIDQLCHQFVQEWL